MYPFVICQQYILFTNKKKKRERHKLQIVFTTYNDFTRQDA